MAKKAAAKKAKAGALAGNATPTTAGRSARSGKATPSAQALTILGRETRGLIVAISDEEWRQASESLGAAHGELAKQVKQVRDDLKAHEAEITARIGKLARLVRNRSDTRPVECELQAHHDKGEALTVRTDTGEIIARRALTASERQLPLVRDDPRPPQADAAAIDAGEPPPPGSYDGEGGLE